ncbi:MAG: ArsR family transcriptional regulator [Candidatus Nanopelagicales bacterium]
MADERISEGRGRVRRVQVFSALADANRLAVVELLAVQDLSPDALAAAVGVPGNLLAHHLKVLEAAGVISRGHSQNDRRRTYVHLVQDTLQDVLPSPQAIEARRVVFVCTRNSARSVLADAAWRAASDFPSASAGTHPAERVHPGAVDAAERAGLGPVSAEPRWVGEVVQPDDLVVSVCDTVNEQLGDLPNQRLHWSIPDPARLGTDGAFAAALAQIGQRVIRLVPLLSPN